MNKPYHIRHFSFFSGNLQVSWYHRSFWVTWKNVGFYAKDIRMFPLLFSERHRLGGSAWRIGWLLIKRVGNFKS